MTEIENITVSQAINRIISESRKDILRYPDRVQLMVMDYVKGYEQEKKLLKISCQYGILEYIRNILILQEEAQKKGTLGRIDGN